ncbi:MAG: hypothetical protein LBI42_12840 [Chitinispirillales bacterium]|jgi:tetratricopeptide (TPR) repeat protein|nr:hypothetical protein [Chitinispirillales bacterium]
MSKKQFPKLKSEDEFESVCAEILTEHFKRIFSRYGRKGQRQSGIDIYCDTENGKRIVAQCKNHLSPNPNGFVKQIEDDIKSAVVKFNIDTFVIMTALDRDTKIQNFISTLSHNYQFTIELWFWEDIQEKILSNADLYDKYYLSLNTSTITKGVNEANAKLDELHSEIENLKKQALLGFKSKMIIESDEEIKSKERLDNVLRVLELACELSVGADNALRTVNKFISLFNELGDIVKKDSLAEITKKCFDIAVQIEVSHDLDFTAHQKYLEWLNVRNDVSRAIDVEECIIKRLEKDNSSDLFEIAKAYGRLTNKCLNVPHCTSKGFLAIENSLSCWDKLARKRLSDEETIEFSRFMDIVAQFFAFDSEPYINSEERNIDEWRTDWLFLSSIQIQVINIIVKIVKGGRFFIKFDEIGFPKMLEMLERGNAFLFHMQQVYDLSEQKNEMRILYPVNNGIFAGEFYALTSFALVAGLLVNGVQVPIGDIATTINTTALIAGREKRIEIQKKLYLEAIRYIEKQKNSEEQCFRLSLAYNNFGTFALQQNDFTTAEIYYRLSLDEVKKRSYEYNKPNNKLLALANISMANLYAYVGKNSDSIQKYEDAKVVFELLEKSEIDPETFNIEYVRCLINLAEQYRMSWINESKETGFYSLDNANKSILALQKALDICQEKYESAVDVYGTLFVNLGIEIAQNYAWFQEDHKSKTTTDVFIEEAIEVCKDVMLRKSKAYVAVAQL